MCVRAIPSRCSTATAETASAPVAPRLLPASSSWCRTQRSPVRQTRTRFMLAAEVSRPAAFAPTVALRYSLVANLPRDSCRSAFPRSTIRRGFSRCWTSGVPGATVGLPESGDSSLSSVAVVRPSAPLRYSVNVTLDGRCDHRALLADQELRRHAIANLVQADAFLVGPVIYEMMEAAFSPPARTRATPDWMEPGARTVRLLTRLRS